MYPAVLTVGGSDSGGGAGIQADIKAFSALGVHGASVITAVTAQNTMGVDAVFPVTPEAVAVQLDSVLKDLEIAGAKTGMLYSRDIVSVVAERLAGSGLFLVLDPVIEAEAGGRLLEKEALKALAEELIPLATVVTPNVFEAEALTGIKVKDVDGAIMAGQELVSMGAGAAIVTGGHLNCTDVLVLGEDKTKDVKPLEGSRVKGGTHGVGCSFSAAVTAYLAKGLSLYQAAVAAKSFAAAAISKSRPVGKGEAPVNQTGAVLDDAERYRVFLEVEEALDRLLDEPALVALIPEVGSNIGMAIPGAFGHGDVAAIEGRLVRSGKRLSRGGPIRFGSSRHIARVILAAMSYDPRIRSAMNIRLSQEVLTVCEDLGLSISTFDRRDQPSGLKTMSWGTARAVEAFGKVPEVIWDGGGPGKEAMVRLLGERATQVASTAAEIARRVKKGA